MPQIGQQVSPESAKGRQVIGVTVIGIDPGASGGISILNPHSSPGNPVVESLKMPETESDVWDVFRKSTSAVMFAVIEQLTGFVGEAVPSHTMFKLGRNYGMLRGMMVAGQIPYELVTPQKWQKALGIPSRNKKESKGQWKNRLKEKAQQLFPKLKVTLATADSLLIMEYARRRYKEIQ